ncbi:hypothetical protein LS70_007970 [Helicobacter sp. MIT 11-5569]|uniref:Cj0814 family flagellar-dependent secreted protein n=1 Tax=Helicobacter sp. MIT 11-5569 TaxID=1548151 RepID=UPI00051FEAC7|nr:hypothetical protein [Helicobacter sp. MIT 11-5569]TLD81220.1 hypothetical protein LS70_007970 [Helicobacter sp. MIT 11-5569]
MRIESTAKTLGLSRIIKNPDEENKNTLDFAKMLENSKKSYLQSEIVAVPNDFLSDVASDFRQDFSLALSRQNGEISNEKNEDNTKVAEKIKQLQKELAKTEAIKLPMRNSPDEPMDIFYQALDLLDYKNTKALELRKEIAYLEKSAFGYSLDEFGYMGEDFNQAAGIPLDYKIHYDTLEKIYKRDMQSDSPYIAATFSKFDFAQSAKNAFESFSVLYGKDFVSNNKILSLEDINALPKGYFATDYSYKQALAKIPNEEKLRQFIDIESKMWQLGISTPPFISFSTQDIQNYVQPRFIEGDKISLDGLFNEYFSRNIGFFREAEYSSEWLAYQEYNRKITGGSSNTAPNTHLINYDTEQRFWDLFNGKISIESHLQELINLGYNHNNTIDWNKDKDNFGSSLAKFLNLFQEILDTQAINNANELLAKQTQISKAQEAQEATNTKESQKLQESKPLNSKQEKMNTFLNNLLRVS